MFGALFPARKSQCRERPRINAALADLHDHVLPSLVQVGHHAVLSGSRQRDRAKLSTGCFVVRMEHGSFVDSFRCKQQALGDHEDSLAPPTKGFGIEIERAECGMVRDPVRSPSNWRLPRVIPGVHINRRDLAVGRFVDGQPLRASPLDAAAADPIRHGRSRGGAASRIGGA